MKAGVPRSLFVAVMTLISSAVPAGCAKDHASDELFVQGYFRLVEAIENGYSACGDVLGPATFMFALSSDPAVVREVIYELRGLANQHNDALSDVEPPPELRQAHTEFLDANVAMVKVYDDFAGDLSNAHSASDLDEARQLYDPKFDAVYAQLNAACLSLEEIARVKGIEIDLGCNRYSVGEETRRSGDRPVACRRLAHAAYLVFP